MTEGEDIITLGSSEEEDDDVLPMVPAPPLPPPGPKIGVSKPPKKGVQIIHLAASMVGPKIDPKPGRSKATGGHKNGDIKNKWKMNGAATYDNEDVICLSSSDDDDVDRKVPELKIKGASSPSPRRGQQKSLIDDEQPSTSAACIVARSSSVASNDESDVACDTNTIKDETNDEDARNVLQDDDEQKSQMSEVGKECFCTDAADNIEMLLKVLRPKLSFKDRKRLRIKIWKTYEKLAAEPLDLHNELSKRISLVIKHVSSENPEVNFWKLLSQLFKQFNADVLKNETFTITYSEAELQTLEKRKEKRKKQLEHKLKQYSAIVKQLDEQEVDWDSEDENNSSFMQRERLITQIMKIHNLICTITKSSRLTGRPIQKAISVKKTTMYPEVEKAVETFINNSGYSEAPEFWEILEVVETSSSESKLHLSEVDRRDLAKTLHRAVIDRRQHLRELDVPLAFPPECDSVQDPAELDPELEAKLQQNAKIATTIKSVVDKFAEQHAAKNGDDEEDVEEEEDEEDDDDGSSSVLESGACFVTSVEEEEDAAVEAWDEPLLEEDEQASSPEDLPTEAHNVATPSNISEAETLVVEEENCNGIQETLQNPIQNNGTLENKPCEEIAISATEIDESPPAKRAKVDNSAEDVEMSTVQT